MHFLHALQYHSNMQSSTTPLVISVRWHEPELVGPAKATPRELKALSDIDDQESLRLHVPFMQFYRRTNERDPARVIREALRQALVYYYPLAGRLREGPNRKLVVDCTGEGVLFVEAEADVELREIGLACDGGFLRPPFPKELLLDVPGSSGILHCPLLLFQVMKLKCGGILLVVRVNHTMMDGSGLVQFLTAIAELTRSASKPSVLPVWKRALLSSRHPPHVTCMHREYDEVEGGLFPLQYSGNTVVERSFFFGPNELSYLRQRLQPHLKRCTTNELLSAFLWQCRTIALRYETHQEVRYFCSANLWSNLNPRLPAGYYGNSFVFSSVVCMVGDLIGNGPDYAVELIKKAKAEATEVYVRSVIDFMATNGRPHIMLNGSWLLSDNTQVGYLGIDFGWGKPVYGGPATAMVGDKHGFSGALVKGVNGKGECGIFALVCLPEPAMERFAKEVGCVIKNSSSTHIQPRI